MYTTRTPTKWWDWGKRTVWRHSECQVRSIRKPKAHMEFGLWMLTSSVQLCMDKRRKWLISTGFEVWRMYFEQLWVTYPRPLIYVHCMQQFHYTVKSWVYCLFGDALSSVHVLQCTYSTSYYVWYMNIYIMCESICAGTQKHNKGSCTHKEADCWHNSVRKARDHGNGTPH